MLFIFLIISTSKSLEMDSSSFKKSKNVIENKSFIGKIKSENEEYFLIQTENGEFNIIEKSDSLNTNNKKKFEDLSDSSKQKISASLISKFKSKFEIHLGLGFFFKDEKSQKNEFFVPVNIGLAFNYNNFSFLTKFEYGYENNKYSLGGSINPQRYFNKYSLLLGYNLIISELNLSLHSGIDYINGIDRGNFLYTNKSLNRDGWSYTYQDFYESFNVSSIEFCTELSISYYLSKKVSIGPFASMSIGNNYSGYLIGLIFKFGI